MLFNELAVENENREIVFGSPVVINDVDAYDQVNATITDLEGSDETTKENWTENKSITEAGEYKLKGIRNEKVVDEALILLVDSYQMVQDEKTSTITVSSDMMSFSADTTQIQSQEGPFQINSIQADQEDMVITYSGRPQEGDLVELSVAAEGQSFKIMIFKQNDSWRMRTIE